MYRIRFICVLISQFLVMVRLYCGAIIFSFVMFSIVMLLGFIFLFGIKVVIDYVFNGNLIFD